MAITLPLPSFKDERVFSARSKRLGVPAHEMLRYQGCEGVVVQELQEARQRLRADRRHVECELHQRVLDRDDVVASHNDDRSRG